MTKTYRTYVRRYKIPNHLRGDRINISEREVKRNLVFSCKNPDCNCVIQREDKLFTAKVKYRESGEEVRRHYCSINCFVEDEDRIKEELSEVSL